MARIIRIGSAVIAAVAAITAAASGQTWSGGGTDWNTAADWNPATVPNSTTAVVNFTDTGAGTVNVSSSVSTLSLTFNNPTTNYNLTSSAGQTLAVVSTITMNGGANSIDQINLANVSTGSLLFGAGGSSASLTVSNNSTNGGSLVIGPNTVIGNPGTGGVIFSGPGSTFFSGSFATSSGGNQVDGGLTKTGPGSLDYSGSGANLGGNMTLSGGTLELDYFSSTASKTSGQLLLDGGSLSLLSNPSTPVIQMIPGGTVVNAGHTSIVGAGAGTITLAAGAITHSVGGTVDITPSASGPTFAVQTSSTNTNGLFGAGPAFATVNGGTGWASVSGVVIAPLAGYSTNIYLSGANTDVTANSSQSSITTNSLRFNTTGGLTLTLSGINTLQSGGVLATPNSIGGTITGGTLEAPSSGELLFHIYNTGFAANSNLVSTTGLTKTGPGILDLGGNNTGLTGPINVNRGGLYATTLAAVASASQINFNDDRTSNLFGGLQSFVVDIGNGANGTLTMPIRLSAGSASDFGTYFSTGFSTNSIITLSGVISTATVPGASPLTTPIRFTTNSNDTSGFYLTAPNTFTGNVSLFQGYLGINADAALGPTGPTGNVLILDTGDASTGGLLFLNSGITIARPVQSVVPTRIVSNGTDSNTISGVISGAGGIYKDGTGTLTITNAANTFTGGVNVLSGTLSFAPTGKVPAGNSITVGSGATFTPGLPNTAGTAFSSITLNGGTFRVPSGSGINYFTDQIVTNASGGTIDYTGAGAEQLVVLSQSGIAINGNSTWLGPLNGMTITNGLNTGDVAITVPTGVTLNNGIALAAGNGFGFHLSGGGTLFQNSDSFSAGSITAPITVSQSTFRVTDASSNGGVGNFGAGAFTLDGGTFSYGGASVVTNKAIALTTNGGTIQIESPSAVLTASGPITGLGGLTKAGPGTLILQSTTNSFTSLTINNGTVAAIADNELGVGPITVNGAGTMQYTGTTSTARTINLVFGTLTVGSGATLTLNGAAVNGGFVIGPGAYAVTGGASLTGVTTYASTPITVTGAASFTNFTNGGALTVAAGPAITPTFTRFTNQGSGAITIGAASTVNLADFQSYGTLTLAPAGSGSGFHTLATNTGSTPLSFNGGSRTFIGTPATATQFLAGLDLHGQNAVVAGGLFVNNGFVGDSSNGGAGTATIIADFGSLVKGAGFFQNSVITQNGGKFQAGNSPGSASFGNFVFGPGGVSNYVFAIDDATGTAGPSPDALGHVSGWGLVKAIAPPVGGRGLNGDFTWTATPSDKLTVAIDTLVNPTTVGIDVAGPMADFDPTRSYSWLAAQWAGTYSGPADSSELNAATSFEIGGFANQLAGSFGWSLDPAGHSLSLIYTPSPVPEPGTMLLTAAGLGAVYLRRRIISFTR
jgi:fibronectin-binding autotransporter adhesin